MSTWFELPSISFPFKRKEVNTETPVSDWVFGSSYISNGVPAFTTMQQYSTGIAEVELIDRKFRISVNGGNWIEGNTISRVSSYDDILRELRSFNDILNNKGIIKGRIGQGLFNDSVNIWADAQCVWFVEQCLQSLA